MARRSCTSYSRSPSAPSPRSMRTSLPPATPLLNLCADAHKALSRPVADAEQPLCGSAVLGLEETTGEKGCTGRRNSIPVLLTPSATCLEVVPKKAPRRLHQLLPHLIVGCHTLPLPQLVGQEEPDLGRSQKAPQNALSERNVS
eukprot:scaffold8498_cov105-Isochrysis_galbana.AAC.5